MPLGDVLQGSSVGFGSGFELGDDFWGGSAVATGVVPGQFRSALAGIGFELDVLKTKRSTIPVQRNSTDTSQEPSEGVLNPQGIWPRNQSDWSKGEGQVFYDRPDSVLPRTRVFTIRGCDWIAKDCISVGQRLERQESLTNAGQLLLKAGTGANQWWYLYDGTTFKLTQTPTAAFSAWTTITGTTGTPKCITHDGSKVFIGTTTQLYQANIGAAAFTVAGALGAIDNVGYVNNHLLVGQANVLKEVDAAYAVLATITTHRSASFRWSILSGGNGFVYAGGTVGGVSELYVLTVSTTTGALQQSVNAITLLPDEVLNCLAIHGQKAVIGTSRGLRIGDIVSSGGLSYGSPIPAGNVTAALIYGRFVYFGAQGIDGVTSGLGRVDLSVAVDSAGNQFSYAFDALPSVVAGQSLNNVLAITISSTTGDVFAVIDQKGLYRQIANGTAGAYGANVGVIDTGWVTFNTIEKKTLLDIDIGHNLSDPFDSILIEVSIDGTTWSVVGTVTGLILTPFTIAVQQARRFRLRFTMTAGAGRNVALVYPRIEYWSFRGMPAPRRNQQARLALMITSQVCASWGEGQSAGYSSPQDIYNYLLSVCNSGQPTTYQEGVDSYTVKVEDLENEPVAWADNAEGLHGIIYATITYL